MCQRSIHALLFTLLIALRSVELPGAPIAAGRVDLLQSENLVAWCIVPFDKKQRTPMERAEMLQRLGIRKVAYDWRERHVPTFEEEILAYQKHGLEYFAFWGSHERAFELFEQYDLRPQLWQTVPSPNKGSQEEKVRAAAVAFVPLVNRARELGCQVGLYNHGGWGGQPENLVAVCQYLRDHHDAQHVGIVYNFHHAHDRIADFEAAIRLLSPYLLCLNLNGMNDGANPKILPIGKGQHERRMIEMVLHSGYSGPIGVLDHRNEMDAEESLKENLNGLALLVEGWVGKAPSE